MVPSPAIFAIGAWNNTDIVFRESGRQRRNDQPELKAATSTTTPAGCWMESADDLAVRPGRLSGSHAAVGGAEDDIYIMLFDGQRHGQVPASPKRNKLC
ncbi:MAG: hypothetical protein ACLRS8_02470 [Parabacteroides merdae]